MNMTTINNEKRNNQKILGLAGIVILAVVFIAGIWGFFGKSETTAKIGAGIQIPNAPQKKSADKPAVVADKVPAALTDAGEFGENIYDAAKINDWKTAGAKLKELKTAAREMNVTKIGSADFDATLGKLEKAVAAKDKTASLIEANQLTLAAANLTAEYNPTVPVEVVSANSKSGRRRKTKPSCAKPPN